MKAHLMHRDRDFDVQQPAPANDQDLVQDLELEALVATMAAGDAVVHEVTRKALLTGGSNDIETVRYRQAILTDAMQSPEVVRELHTIVAEAIAKRKRTYIWGYSAHYPSSVLRASIEVMEMFLPPLRRLRGVAARHLGRFRSEGMVNLLTMLQRELSDEYFARVRDHLEQLRFPDGVLESAELGDGNEGTGYVLRDQTQRAGWLDRLLRRGPPEFTFRIPERDESGAQALARLRDRGVNLVANALAQSSDHILSFFNMLRVELAFYVGCLNLRDALVSIGAPLCMPDPAERGSRIESFRELYDVSLALTMKRSVIANSIDATGKSLVVITGANQGGKSTFLRSIGLAQVMMQCGMFVGAETFIAELCTNVFTHSKREEDPRMEHGKLDEELSRMSAIVDATEANALLLCNESFASTNEREGSEIAAQITSALVENRVKVVFVTHLYEFARGMFDMHLDDALFLRAERLPDGTRTFHVVEGEPLETSYGGDLYREVFG